MRIIRQNILFYLCCAIFFIWGSIYLLVYDKSSFSLWTNEQRSPFNDIFFQYITWLGDGITVTIIVLSLLFIKFRFAMLAAIISIVSSLLIVLLKNIFDEPRPSIYIKDVDLNYVKGVTLYQHFSFPSGHTAAAFSLYCVLALMTKNKYAGIFFFMLALVVGASRIYLFQHFLTDVYFGALIGVVVSTLLFIYLSKSGFIKNKTWHDRSLIRRKKINPPE